MAARVEFLHVAVCGSGKCLSQRVEAVSLRNLPLEEAAEPSRPAGQLSELEEKSRDEAVRQAVLALPKRYREPVVLFYFHEMDVAAAARTMRLPEGTVKARLARARALLRRRFPRLAREQTGMEISKPGDGREA